jgi:putative nucleotidyltransferase with HDIG domain
LLIGSTIRDYRIVTELGGGGMGTVYFAEHTVIGRRAAIKVLNRDVASNEEIVGRFFNEAKAVNAIRHPNIVDITDFGQQGTLYYIIMEMLEGETLGARMERDKKLNEAVAIRILSQVASAVGAVHDRGIVHRDIKPENIFLTNHPDYPDFVKVLDFGVVKLMGSPPASAHKTMPGTAIGTPAYMSPEQCLGLTGLDHRSDIYSLGIVAYEMLTGATPFPGDSLEQMMGHTRGKVVPPNESNPAVSEVTSAILLKALEKKPEDRFASMKELRQALEAAIAPPLPAPAPAAAARPSARPAPPAAVTAPSPPPRAPAGPVAMRSARPQGTRAAQPMPADPVLVEKIERAQTKKVGGKMREIIAKRISENRLQIPSMPVVALRALEIMRDPNAKFSEIAATVEKDPLIASRLLRIVNSPAFGARDTITSMEAAVSRLGLKPLKLLLIELSAREVFVSRNRRIREAFRGIWEHCLAVGMLARDIAASVKGGADRDAAYLAGLFHDVGKPVVGALLLEAERTLVDELDEPFMTDSLWLKVVSSSHREVGATLAKNWNLPASAVDAIAGLDAYDDAAGAGSCTNLVRYANAMTKREGLYVGEVDSEALIGVISEGRRVLGIDDKMEDQLIANLRERVETVTTAGSGSSDNTHNVGPKS